MPTARMDYNQTIVRSQNEQLLLNLVRMRYQDTPLFLDLNNVVDAYTSGPEFSLDPGISSAAGALTRSLSASAKGTAWGDSPTITYTPLQGEEFARRMLTPIQPQTLLLLSHLGWGMERLFFFCTQRINDASNGTAIGGVAPVRIARYQSFRRAIELLRMLQEEGCVELEPMPKTEDRIILSAGTTPPTDEARRALTEVSALLGLPKGAPDALWAPAPADRKPVEIVLRGRSLMGVMTFLAQDVEVPPVHMTKGLVRQPLGPDGKPFLWSDLSRGMFRVHSGPDRPATAAIQVSYRGHWFWIADDDLESKATFALLNQLFSLQATSGKAVSPLLMTLQAH